jgi:hypothetical protein
MHEIDDKMASPTRKMTQNGAFSEGAEAGDLA